MRTVYAVTIFCGFLMLQGATAIRAQSGPEKGGHELQLWTGGGHGVRGVAKDTGVWNVGARYGWILSNPRGPGFLRGRFEYAVDAVPVFWMFQPGGTAYGAGIDPFALKWNFVSDSHVVPYVELGGGVVFSNRQAPPGTSRVNFTDSAAVGAHILRAKLNWSAEIRYTHISNAGIAASNPGINTLQVRIGIGMFTGGKK